MMPVSRSGSPIGFRCDTPLTFTRISLEALPPNTERS